MIERVKTTDSKLKMTTTKREYPISVLRNCDVVRVNSDLGYARANDQPVSNPTGA